MAKRIIAVLAWQALLCAAALAQTPPTPTDPTLPQRTVHETMPNTTGYTIRRVCPTATCTDSQTRDYTETQLQTAIDFAEANCSTTGVRLLLDPALNINSSTFFSLGTNNCSDNGTPSDLTDDKWIIIESMNAASLPAPGTRLCPDNGSGSPDCSAIASHVPTINLSGANIGRLFQAEFNARRYRVIGIKGVFTATSGSAAILIRTSPSSGSPSVLADWPRQIIIDRVWLVGNSTRDTYSGVNITCGDCAVVDSVIQGIQTTTTQSAQDSNAVGGCFGDGPILIRNNYLSASAIPIFWGGCGSAPSFESLPNDVTITKNYVKKVTAFCTGPVISKSVIEHKEGKRFLYEGNIFDTTCDTNNQRGQFVNLKNSDSGQPCTYCTTQDITFRYNWFYTQNVGEGPGYWFDTQPYTVAGSTGHPHMKRIKFIDNIVEGVSKGQSGEAGINSMAFHFSNSLCTGASCDAAAAQVGSDFQVKHNTVIASDRNVSIGGGVQSTDAIAPPALGTCTERLLIQDVIIPMTRDGSTATQFSYVKCSVSGVQTPSAAWSNGSDSFVNNLLTNATASAITTPFDDDDKAAAEFAVGRSADQCSLFETCTVANIGKGPGLNYYKLKNTSPGFNDAFDAAARTSAGLSTDVGADVDKVAAEICGVRNGNYSSCTGAPAPTVTGSTPNTGSHLGGTAITNLAGTNFVSGATVTYGGSACTSVVVVSATEIECVTPAHAAGTVDIVVANPDAQNGTCTGCFTYTGSGAPTVSTVVPGSGSTDGGTVITITGTNFGAGATVTVAGTNCGNVVVNSSTEIVCTTSSTSAPITGNVVVTVSGQDGTLTNGFTYSKPVQSLP